MSVSPEETDILAKLIFLILPLIPFRLNYAKNRSNYWSALDVSGEDLAKAMLKDVV